MSGMRGKDGGRCISVCEMIDKAKTVIEAEEEA
jgi:hypothetical protein